MQKEVFLPKTMNDLFNVFRKEKDYQLCAGGTYKRITQNAHVVVSLMYIDELKKISFSQTNVNFGACCSLFDVKNYTHTPMVIKSAINQIFPYHIQDLATIGGNLFVKDETIGLAPLLSDFFSDVEIRKIGKMRYEDIDIINLKEEEILTSVRIKRNRFNIGYFRILGKYNSVQNIALSILGNIYNGVISEFYVNIYFSNLPNLSITINQFMNKKLPLNVADTNSMINEILELINLKKWSCVDYYYDFIEKEIRKYLTTLI